VWGPVAPVWKGEERISFNLGMAKLGGHSPERGKTAATLGKIRREGEASRGRGQWSECGIGGEVGGAREGGQSGVSDEGVDEWRVGRVFERARSVARLRGKKERRGGVQPWGCHMVRGGRGAWPEPVGGAPTVSWPAVTRTRSARAARRCSDRGALGTDEWAPVVVRAGRERRGAHEPAREENGAAEPR
jgi:hypothetical protein